MCPESFEKKFIPCSLLFSAKQSALTVGVAGEVKIFMYYEHINILNSVPGKASK